MRDRSHSSQPYAGLRLLAVHAHPDDEASKGAATSAKYAALGARVLVLTMTGGEAGDILNPALEESPAAIRDIAGLRRTEMALAAGTLGVEHVWAGYVDSGLPDGDPDELTPRGSFYRVPIEVSARTVVSVLRRFRPHVMTTYDERGGYPHPDHIRTHDVSMVAVEQADQAGTNPELGEPWTVQKTYYNQDLSAHKFLRIHELMLAEGGESPFEEQLEWLTKRDAERHTWLTARVPSGEYFEVRDRALIAHATQIDPNGGFFFGSRAQARRLWRSEEFELAIDRTGRPPLDREQNFLESDLFAGVTDDDGDVVPDDLMPEEPQPAQAGSSAEAQDLEGAR
ncbi:MAG TPA: mycothiol conjugate amidase Mca [Brevibacterium senegalense]|uniref:Mycothiol S-conjugate amidase n=1 Tax=Brevibacterium senegalense TaxID=1033736 RepID=A0A921MG87_9MICO|nr:mycothiol conjugate amidase Mca [Brevibacterium senegalense]